MTTIQAQILGDSAIVPRSDFDRLVEIARRAESIQIQVVRGDDVSTADMMRLAERGGAFEFWHESGEDIYTTSDGESIR